MREKGTLYAVNLPVDQMMATLADLQKQVGDAQSRQEDLKRDLKEATHQYNELKRKMYATASGYLDTAIAAVDKRSDAAKNFRRLRSRIRRLPSDDIPAQTPEKITQEPTPELTS